MQISAELPRRCALGPTAPVSSLHQLLSRCSPLDADQYILETSEAMCSGTKGHLPARRHLPGLADCCSAPPAPVRFLGPARPPLL
jgi:hypothetical protein